MACLWNSLFARAHLLVFVCPPLFVQNGKKYYVRRNMHRRNSIGLAADTVSEAVCPAVFVYAENGICGR